MVSPLNGSCVDVTKTFNYTPPPTPGPCVLANGTTLQCLPNSGGGQCINEQNLVCYDKIGSGASAVCPGGTDECTNVE